MSTNVRVTVQLEVDVGMWSDERHRDSIQIRGQAMSFILTDAEGDQLAQLAARIKTGNFFGGEDGTILGILNNGATAARAKAVAEDSIAIPIERPGDRFILKKTVYYIAGTEQETFNTIAEARKKQGETRALATVVEVFDEYGTFEPSDRMVVEVVEALAKHWGITLGVDGNPLIEGREAG